MNRRTRQVIIIAGGLLVLVLTVCFARSLYATKPDGTISPGMEPYTPTRLEWLAMDLEASYKIEDSDSEYNLSYFAAPPDTIVVDVEYSAKTRASLVDKAANHGVKMAKRVASQYKWDNWVKVRIVRNSD